MGQPPVELTFHRFGRPAMLVVNRISFPSGDHEALETSRVKYRSSIGTGRALRFDEEFMDWGSVIRRSSGPLDCAAKSVEDISARKIGAITRRRFIFGLAGNARVAFRSSIGTSAAFYTDPSPKQQTLGQFWEPRLSQMTAEPSFIGTNLTNPA